MVKTLKHRLRSMFFLENQRLKKEEQRFLKNKEEQRFLKNGSKFLEDLIADCNGKSIHIRFFSSSQILKATNNFDSPCFVTDNWSYEWYKCIIEDRSYIVKEYIGTNVSRVYNDIVLSARMSSHDNFLKLSGCCLEFIFPVLVFGYEEHVLMNENGRIMVNGEESSLPLRLRLKIAKEIAIALTYLHTAFPKITIHRTFNPTSIFLDGNMTAKLSGLSFAITLPEGKTFLEDNYLDVVWGTTGFEDRAYVDSGLLTEYADVYSFGVFLMIILTDKPKMIDVAKELKRIQQMEQSLNVIESTENSLDNVEITEESLVDTSELLKHEVVEDGSSMVKRTKKLGFKIEIILILTFCIGILMSLLFHKAYM
ncbi:unnamed protein product [Cochlearia groenlandica]